MTVGVSSSMKSRALVVGGGGGGSCVLTIIGLHADI